MFFNYNLERLAVLLHMIANPLRLEILFCLQNQPMCVCDLAVKLHRRQPCISQHLMLLRKADIVNFQRDGWRRDYYICSESVHQILPILQNMAGREELQQRLEGLGIDDLSS